MSSNRVIRRHRLGPARRGVAELGGHLGRRRRAEIGLDDRRIALDLRRCALGDLAAELDHVDVVADVQDEAHVVIDEEDRHAGVDDPPQSPTEFERLVGVEAGGGLVHADELAAARRAPGRRTRVCAGPG